MILTDTPITEALEAEARAPTERKQPKKRTIQLPQDDDTSDSDADKDPPVLSDSEEGSNEEEADSLTMEPGRYVVVRYSSKKVSQMYVGQITEMNRTDSLVTVTYLQRSGASFIRPENENIDTVSADDAVKILNDPKTVGGTARVALKLLFDDELDMVKQ